jgi:hypothetical protein
MRKRVRVGFFLPGWGVYQRQRPTICGLARCCHRPAAAVRILGDHRSTTGRSRRTSPFSRST